MIYHFEALDLTVTKLTILLRYVAANLLLVRHPGSECEVRSLDLGDITNEIGGKRQTTAALF